MEITALPAEINSVFATDGDVIIDVGGNDDGATVLGRFSGKIKEKGYEMLYVTNMYRPLTADPKDSMSVLRAIEEACRLKATAIVNNSHLKDLTTVRTITDSMRYAKEVSRTAEIPLLFSAVPRGMIKKMPEDESFYPVDVYVRTVWEKGAIYAESEDQ
jgi:hypothetical protein